MISRCRSLTRPTVRRSSGLGSTELPTFGTWSKSRRSVSSRVKKLAIRSASFSPDGKTLACVGDEGLVRLWDLPTRMLKKTWSGLSDALLKAARSVNLDAVVFAPDGESTRGRRGAGKNPDVPEAIYEVRVFDSTNGTINVVAHGPWGAAVFSGFCS